MRFLIKVTVYLMAASLSSETETFNHLIPNCDNKDTVIKEAYVGGSVTIRCDYKGRRITRYFCRQENKITCTKLERSNGCEEKICLKDDKKTHYNATIASLTQMDAGIYYCAQYHTPLCKTIECTKKIRLLTKRRIAGIIVGAVAGVLLLIAGLLLIALRHKLPYTQAFACCAAEGSSDRSADSGDDTKVNCSEETQKTETRAGNAASTVYATANHPPDLLHYASVNFQNGSVTVLTEEKTPPGPGNNDSAEYSAVRRDVGPPAAEHNLYSTVKNPKEP